MKFSKKLYFPFNLAQKKESQTRLSMTPWTAWGACKVDALSGRCQQIRTRTCFNVSLDRTLMPPTVSKFPETSPNCPDPVFESRVCDSSECSGKILFDSH